MVSHPWIAAVLLGSAATPAAVILAVPAPRPLDAILAWPLVLMDVWVGSGGVGRAPGKVEHGALARVAALALGIALTWVHYVVLARLVIWRVADIESDEP